MTIINRRSYGLSADVFITRKASSETLVLGGRTQGGIWTRVLSQRAAQLLWFRLAQILFPERADQLTAYVVTTPLRDALLPTITTSVEVDEIDADQVEITGWTGGQNWTVELPMREARRLWSSLDEALEMVSAPSMVLSGE